MEHLTCTATGIIRCSHTYIYIYQVIINGYEQSQAKLYYLATVYCVTVLPVGEFKTC